MTGSEFRALRTRTRLSLRGLARLWRLHHMSLWRYETGRRKVPPAYATLLLLMAHAARPCPHCGGSGIQRH
jgi:transcriptional regulator with XRE-family HTH domain